MPSIYVDFHNTTRSGKVRLNTIGTIRDLNREGTILQNGLTIRLYSEDFEVTGTVEFEDSEHVWVAAFNWDNLKSIVA
jgi:hypothetical protein